MYVASASKDADVSLYLHAELLPNIRQITLYISISAIPAFDGIKPQVQLSESRRAVTVSLPEPYNNVAETIKLPARVSDATPPTLNINANPASGTGERSSARTSHDYSVRMQIASNEEMSPRDESMDDHVPWTAKDMSSSTCIRCRQCGNSLLKSSATCEPNDQGFAGPTQERTWKDLPSGNWAEMMDFWHCHKPDPHEDDSKAEANAALRIEESTAETKGYGASSRVSAIRGTILVDVATFLLEESDCVGLKKVSTSNLLQRYSLPVPSTAIIFPWATQKETISFLCCGLRYYCPRLTHVRFSWQSGLVVSGSVLVQRPRNSHPLSLDGSRSLLEAWVVPAAALPGLPCSTLFDFNGSLGFTFQRSGIAVNRRGTSILGLPPDGN